MGIYLDNCATTSVKKEVLDVMLPFFNEKYYNPSSLYDGGIFNRKVINDSRKKIGSLLNCDYKEVYFTSGGSESNNWAIKGLASKNEYKREIISTKIEHHAIINTLNYLETKGYIIKYVDLDEDGYVNLNQLHDLINDNTLMVSIHFANNEIGTIQPIKEIAKLCHEKGTIFHTDAVQACGHIKIDLRELDVDMMSISGHKFHAPKGIGMLYIKNGLIINNLIHGGQQENKMRAGTENIPYIVGMTKAMELAYNDLKDYQLRVFKLLKLLYQNIKDIYPDVLLNGPKDLEKRLPGNLNLAFKNIDSNNLLYNLNKMGVYASTSSACDSDSIEPSHVIRAIKIPKEYELGAIRFSIGDLNTLEEIKKASAIILEALKLE